MGFASDGFFEDLLPRFDVGAHVVEGFSVDLDVQWRVGCAVEDGVESYIPAQAVGEEEAGDDAFVGDVESSCVVEVAEVWAGLALA